MTQNPILSMAGLADLRRQTPGDPEICVAVIDSRVDLSHPALAGAQLKEIVPAWLSSRIRSPGASHGTHVASIIFGQPGGPVEGIAPRCRGIAIPVYGETPGGDLMPCSQEDLARAISLALEAGAHLINISGGELIEPGDVDVFLAKVAHSCDQQNVAIIAATGNEGCECLHAPASLPTVLAVGAADARGLPMPFSNWDDSLASHGVLAPGEGIPGAIPGGGVAAHNGTSFACPIVTGVAALLLCRQKLDGDRPNPRAVRDAIVASAIPCTPDEQAACERMLGGRLNPRGACEVLFEGGAVIPSEMRLRSDRLPNSIRSPPLGFAPAAQSQPNQHRSMFPQKEATVMMHEHFQGQPQAASGMDHGVSPQGGQAPPEQLAPAQPSTWPSVGQLAAVQPSGVLPQGCGCPTGQPQQGMSPSQEEAPPVYQNAAPAQQSAPPAYQSAPPAYPSAPPAYQNVVPMQHGGPAYHGGMPAPTPIGIRPALSPAQRTALLAGYPASGGQQMAMPSVGGVTASQATAGCPCPLPNDFISAENSQLVYAIGTLGYDFITDARRDYFVQQFRNFSDDANSEYIGLFRQILGLQPNTLYYPEDHRAMAAYLYQGPSFHIPGSPAIPGQFLPDAVDRASDVGSLVWVLFQENQPLYALRPLHTFAPQVLEGFANFLFNQSRPVNLLDAEGKEIKSDDGKPTPNENCADRVSIAGRIVGDITLYNGQRVPVLDVSLRALFQWTITALIKDVIAGDTPAGIDANPNLLQPGNPMFDDLTDFLQRIYYEVRNLGQSPSDRAINFMATQIFETHKVFAHAISKGLVLDSINVEKSPLCRPKSDCWDVVMRFFNPAKRLEEAVQEYRLTADVNDISPVQIGDTRKWRRFA